MSKGNSTMPPPEVQEADELWQIDHLFTVSDETRKLADFCENVEALHQAKAALDREIRRRTFAPDGCVYVLRAGDYYKIGRSRSVHNRIKQLTIQLPFPVEVVYIFACEDMAAAESWFHETFADERVNGEWFILHDELLSPFELYKDRGILYRRGDDFPAPVITWKQESGAAREKS